MSPHQNVSTNAATEIFKKGDGFQIFVNDRNKFYVRMTVHRDRLK